MVWMYFTAAIIRPVLVLTICIWELIRIILEIEMKVVDMEQPSYHPLK